MAKNKTQLTILEQMLAYQTRLQGVANDLAIKLADAALSTNADVAKFIATELPKKSKSIKAELERIERLIAKIETLRAPSYKLAQDLIFSTSADVVQAATDETAKEFNRALANAARKEREKRFCKTLTPAQQQAILDGQAISGSTIAYWYRNWQRKDLERIASACQQASVEELSIRDIYRLIRGTKANAYSDGILAATQASAVTLARTIVNGVSNNARVETIKANSDVVDGVKFVGTLDGKTCPYCASLDGYIWRGDEMSQARRPPIHPNCRCTLIPYVELKDEQGNVVDVESNRPAANADFDKLAKDAYNANARQRGLTRRWDDLAPSTRLKYYYEAQKEFEARTGQKAYDQVPADLTFADYFKNQPDAFKRSWLGAKRFELYQQDKLDEDKIFAPNLSYKATAAELFQISKADQETAQELAELAKETGREMEELAKNKGKPRSEFLTMEKGESFGDALRRQGFQEMAKNVDEILAGIKVSQNQQVKGFVEQKTIEEAAKFAKENFGIELLYRPKKRRKKKDLIDIDVANDIIQELCRAKNIIGTVGIVNRIATSNKLFDKKVDKEAFGNYIRSERTINLRPGYGRLAAKQYIEKARDGLFSTRSPLHGYRHEIGHALLFYFEERLNVKDRRKMIRELQKTKRNLFELTRIGFSDLSEYASKNYSEMIAEAFAKLLNGETNSSIETILNILNRRQ